MVEGQKMEGQRLKGGKSRWAEAGRTENMAHEADDNGGGREGRRYRDERREEAVDRGN